MTLRKWILLSVLFGTLVGCGGPYSSGDRVLVSKLSYDLGVTKPERYQVVVFKYPEKPMENNTPKNYIKRLLGLPGELLAIFFGRIYHRIPQDGEGAPFDDLKDGKVDENDLWRPPYMHRDDTKSRNWFQDGKFAILRKPPEIMLALRRNVYDNDYQAKDLKGKFDRWNPDPKSGWKTDKGTGFAFEPKNADDIDWLRYQHLVVERSGGPIVGDQNIKPRLITDSMDYNNFKPPVNAAPVPHWVGDLMIESNVEVSEAKGEFYFELSKGIYRYRARWDLATGQCTLLRIGKDGKQEVLASKETNVKGPGAYMLRFANIDARLTVWVDSALPFGDGKEYDPPEVRAGKDDKRSDPEILESRGPDRREKSNDLEPASIGSKGAAVKITHVRLWRDTYYTTSASSGPDYDQTGIPGDLWTDPTKWERFRDQKFATMYVQPRHFLCLGDNSQASSDSREWGVVPERLMLGRALVVYFPIERIGPIR